MTKTILSTLFISAILFTGAIAASVDLTQFAEGAKAEGKPGSLPGPKLYGSSTGSVVCGEILCSEYTGGYEQFKKDQGQGSKIGSEATKYIPTFNRFKSMHFNKKSDNS